MEKSWSSKNCEMSKSESLISKNTYFHFKGPKGSVILKAMNFIKQAQEHASGILTFQFWLTRWIFMTCNKSLKFFPFCPQKNWHKNKGIGQNFFLNSTRVKLKMVTKAHNFNNSSYSTIIFNSANYG